jgi:hypothetical protein
MRTSNNNVQVPPLNIPGSPIGGIMPHGSSSPRTTYQMPASQPYQTPYLNLPGQASPRQQPVTYPPPPHQQQHATPSKGATTPRSQHVPSHTPAQVKTPRQPPVPPSMRPPQVRVCLSVFIRVGLYVCVCICICVHVSMHASTCICIKTHEHIHTANAHTRTYLQ